MSNVGLLYCSAARCLCYSARAGSSVLDLGSDDREARTARVRLGVMGGRNPIELSKAVRAELGVEIGDAVETTVDLDVVERAVEVPGDLAAALDAAPGARAAFDALPFTRCKELARGVAEAKRPETRDGRIAAVLAELVA